MKIQHFILILLFFISCEKKTNIPPDLYNRESMANIMEEVYILEFRVNELKFDKDSIKKVYLMYENEFFLENDYDTSKYRKSLEYYLNHPDHMEYIYSIIADSLSLRNKLEEMN